jgi:glycosyltransferase involved in cell wall biosynthesis
MRLPPSGVGSSESCPAPDRPMRIGIDVRYLSHGLVGGVHTYVKHFVTTLLELGREHEIFLYADSKRIFELSDLPPNVRVRLLSWRTPLSSVYHDMAMRRYMAADQVDVAHFPANYGFGPTCAGTVLTVHDSINVLPLREIVRGHQKSARTLAMMTYLHWCTGMAVKRARMIITVSAHARGEIARHTGFALDRIVAIPHAPASDLCRVTDQSRLVAVRARHRIETPFVLADALKNPAVLVDAWRQLPISTRSGRQMVFFSRHPDIHPRVQQAVLAGRAQVLVRPSREDLIALYSMADAFVFPSWMEGFGLPILEAMACGAPVIASDRGAIPEVAGDAALMSDAEDVDGLRQHLQRVLDNPAEANHLRSLGYARVAEYSWQRTVGQILETYARAAVDGAIGAPGIHASLTKESTVNCYPSRHAHREV